MMTDFKLLAQLRRLAADSQRLATLLLLSQVDQPAKNSALATKAASVGFRAAVNWNLSDNLKSSEERGHAARLPTGWKILPEGIEELKRRGCELDETIVAEARHGLQEHVAKVRDPDRRRFLEEALICLDAKAYRAAVVLAWVGAVHILQQYVVNHHLAAFNAAGAARFPKDFRAIRNVGDFGRTKEVDFLLLCEDASILGKSEKQELGDRLNMRNRCGHPNSLSFKEHAVASHVETLISTVYDRY